MLCDNCESELRRNWKFCPACGAETIHEDIFISLGNILRGITREMEPSRQAPFTWPEEEAAETEPARKNRPKRSIEPKTLIRNLGNRIFFEIKLPDVDPDEVRLTELDESFEIKAFAGDKAYFKIITVPQGFSLEDQYFEKGRLIMEFVA
ncbi:MAG: zinc ribbon domain-containing protein [Candidatus Aenigmarchaeota archaeon]|nr:zinc ribbon domain-containing protein [Candidatus Aenigmarchaeota archaeon]